MYKKGAIVSVEQRTQNTSSEQSLISGRADRTLSMPKEEDVVSSTGDDDQYEDDEGEEVEGEEEDGSEIEGDEEVEGGEEQDKGEDEGAEGEEEQEGARSNEKKASAPIEGLKAPPAKSSKPSTDKTAAVKSANTSTDKTAAGSDGYSKQKEKRNWTKITTKDGEMMWLGTEADFEDYKPVSEGWKENPAPSTTDKPAGKGDAKVAAKQ
jgi:hypothetical protein